MRYTEHQIATMKAVEDLIKKGAIEIEIGKRVFGFGPIVVKANQEDSADHELPEDWPEDLCPGCGSFECTCSDR